jgi:hypothetical protein
MILIRNALYYVYRNILIKIVVSHMNLKAVLSDSKMVFGGGLGFLFVCARARTCLYDIHILP